MSNNLTLDVYSDILCVWAHISQVRIDEVEAKFPDAVQINYRFCSIFGDTAHKVGNGWQDRGGYEGFGRHLQDSVAPFDHITLHPDVWFKTRPTSSTPAHLFIKAVQRVDTDRAVALIHVLRDMFFEQGLDISAWDVLRQSLIAVDLNFDDIVQIIYDGHAFADLEADRRQQQSQLVQGSPTILLNEGRQKLYGNVGYSVIEANIRELLKSPAAGAASWC